MAEILWTREERFSETVSSQMFFTDSAAELLCMLQGIADEVPLGWSDAGSNIVKGTLWARSGWFVPKMETFVDAFDHTVYTTQVWYYENPAEGDPTTAMTEHRQGVELHGMFEAKRIEKIAQAVLLSTVGELRGFLKEAGEQAVLLAKDVNFELGGSLTAKACLWLYEDKKQGKSCLMLRQ